MMLRAHFEWMRPFFGYFLNRVIFIVDIVGSRLYYGSNFLLILKTGDGS